MRKVPPVKRRRKFSDMPEDIFDDEGREVEVGGGEDKGEGK